MATSQNNLEMQVKRLTAQLNDLEEQVAVLMTALALVTPVPGEKRLTLKTAASQLITTQKSTKSRRGAVERLFDLQHRFHPGKNA
jgi:hypothetical protein